jgi:hypothetical protein
MVLEEGEGSLEKVAVEIHEREKEGINKVVSWLLGAKSTRNRTIIASIVQKITAK